MSQIIHNPLTNTASTNDVRDDFEAEILKVWPNTIFKRNGYGSYSDTAQKCALIGYQAGVASRDARIQELEKVLRPMAKDNMWFSDFRGTRWQGVRSIKDMALSALNTSKGEG